MAMPSHEDLQRLKSFIEFVSVNPTILNVPQLSFVKNFIEKFGGSVPDGEFKMPTGGQCPFGEGVKSEKIPTNPEKESDSDEAEMEDSDQESEVELDMDVGMYLDDETTAPTKNAIFLCPRELTKEELTSNDETAEDPIKPTEMDATIKVELRNVLQRVRRSEMLTDDEIFEDSSNDSDYFVNIPAEEDASSNGVISDCQRSTSLAITRRSKRKTKMLKPPHHRGRASLLQTCRSTCRYKCEQNVDRGTQQEILNGFLGLDAEGRKNFLQAYIEAKKVKSHITQRRREKRRNYTYCYYLRNRDGVRTRVCVKFFGATLRLTDYAVKSVLENRPECSSGKGPAQEVDHRKCASAQPTKKRSTISAVDVKDNQAICDKATENIEIQTGPFNYTESDAEIIAQATKRKKEHKVEKGKRVRRPQLVNCETNCQWKCTRNFTEEQRAQMCTTFWSMDFKRRKDFILARIETRELLSVRTQEYRKSARAVRGFTNRYYFRTARGENVRVCAGFFAATLCIGQHFVHNAMKRADNQTGSFAGEDMRGRHPAVNKIPDEMLQEIRKHIESYPTWVPNKSSKTRYLQSSLSISKMYRQYKEACLDQHRKYVSSSFYSNVFHKQFRLAFLKPSSKQHIKTAKSTKLDGPISRGHNGSNTSGFTGDEGGFWLQSASETATLYSVQIPPALSVDVQSAGESEIGSFFNQQSEFAATNFVYPQGLSGVDYQPQSSSNMYTYL